ncbi:hypothetical protein IWQ56_002489, partial [Coemansia nantahalensis]
MAAGRIGAAIGAYEELRKRARGEGAEPRPAEMPQQGELRRLHLSARQLAGRVESGERQAAHRAIVHAIGDMQWLGMRIGATEIAAHVYAQHSLGNHADAIEAWREGVSRWCADAGAGPGADRRAVRFLFPQSHQHALAAATALRDAGLVRDVYCLAARAMEISHQMAVGTASQKLHAQRAPLLWSLFPAGSRLAHRRAQVLGAEPGADRPWDAARLGSQFLARVYEDAVWWAAGDGRLVSRVAQMQIRALFGEGRREGALRLYGGLGRARTTPEILCEVVGGLCRHAQLDAARRLLAAAPRALRGLPAWNAYFDGLANGIRRASAAARPHAAAPDESLRRLRRAIDAMEAADGLAPDAVTRAIWLRACFRAGDWEAAERGFDAASDGVVLWDTFIRGALGSSLPAAQRTGWRQIDRLVRQTADAAAPPVDRRLAETVLRCVLHHVTAECEPAYSPGSDVVDRVFRWAEARLSLGRGRTFAIIIAAQIRGGRMDHALELYHAMRRRGLDPPPAAVSSMVAAALEPPAAALAFAQASVPPQHYGAVFLRLLKAAAQHRRY